MRSFLRDRAWMRQIDRRVMWGGAGAAIVLLGVAGFILARPTPTAPVGASEPTPIPTATPIRARATPPGTPAPRPTAPVGISASIPVKVPPGPLPTATPEPGLWRIEGYVVDEAGQPIENVCVVVGPAGCRPFSPHTDERGHYFIDVASASVSATVSVAFNFYFEMPGRETVWMRVLPTSSTVFNLVLRKT
jgi:hypothetical protein